MQTVETREFRAGFVEALMELAEKNQDIIAITPDLMGPMGLTPFAQRFPDQFFNIGIAEQNGVGFAAGLAQEGKIPFVVTFSTFTTGRAYEQIRVDVAYMNTNVKIVGMAAGLTGGLTGSTHMGIEELSSMRALPNMTVVAPADANSTSAAVTAIVDYEGPVYLRLGRPAEPIIYPKETEFVIGKASKLRQGDDVALIGVGPSVYQCLLAADNLAKQDIKCRVIDMSTVKPLDEEAIIACARETKGIVTVEEHSVLGGLGGAVCEVVAAKHPCRVERVGLKDVWPPAGDMNDLRRIMKVDAPAIEEAVHKVLGR
ncbi:MAG: transketolase family protein [Limnochordia bacterium]